MPFAALRNVLSEGRSEGRITAKELVSLVATAGVDTFVCLQESYNEYGVDDYRQTLRQRLMGPSFGGKRQKAVRFLHCPVPDFGVLHDASLLALVGELQKAMAGGHVLYVHCMRCELPPAPGIKGGAIFFLWL